MSGSCRSPGRSSARGGERGAAVARVSGFEPVNSPGSVLGQCAVDRWHVAIEVRELASLEDGSPADEDTPEDQLRYPQAYCDSSEIMIVREPGQQT